MNNLRRLILFVIWLSIYTSSLTAQQIVLDRIVAVVGRECVLLSDLNARVEFYVFNNRMDPNTPGLKEQVLDQIIDEKLIISKAAEDTMISVSDGEVSNQLDALISQRIQQTGSEQKLEELYGMPINKMRREWRDEMRKQIMAQKYQQMKFGEIKVSRREVEEFYSTYKDSLPPVPEQLELYHIFRVPAPSDEMKNAVKKQAQGILDSVRAGGDFDDFARRYSEDPGSATAGGDLGFARRGQFVAEFEEAVFGLKENQLADLVETKFGLHIIQLLERRGDAVHARHILFKIRQDSSAISTAIAFLRSLKDSIVHGARFEELAKKYSDDKESAPLGGLLGHFTIEQFDKFLLKTVEGLKDGDISEPAEVAYGASSGYHIVLVKRRIPEHKMNLDDDWGRLEQLATTFKSNKEYAELIKKLREEVAWDNRLQERGE